MMNAVFFAQNRKRLKQQVSSKLIIVAGNEELQRRADAAFAFVQDSSFYYLTGITEAGWKLVFIESKEVLIAPYRSETQTLFDGSLRQEDARQQSGIEEIVDEKQWKKLLENLVDSHETVATLGKDPHQKHYGFSVNPGPEKNLRSLRRLFGSVEDIRPILNKLRAIKQPQEIEAIKEAVAVSIDGFNRIKQNLQNYSNEREIVAQLTYDFISGKSNGHAYDPIVASGSHACTLHYTKNNSNLRAGELLLIDAGATSGEYAADITRTYAIGEVSNRHKAVHAAVNNAHHQIVALLRPGLLLKDYSKRVDEIMITALKELNLYTKASEYRKYFPHSVSHGLGIDVHDSLGGYSELKSGMVLTVEPGIYIPEEGIGVRIEDDILITPTGNENLSAKLPTSL